MRIRCYWHYIAGFLAGFSGCWNAGLPIAGTICFLAYEIKQDIDKHTISYLDIQEFCIGLFIGIATIIPIKILGVL